MKETINTRRQLRKALLACRDFEGVAGKISFDSRGEVEKEILLLTIGGKKMTVLK